MRCMKCGVQIGDQDSFCQNCLGEMEKYPVQSNIPIQLPIRNETPTPRRKARRYREGKPEDLLRQQRKTIRRLRICLAISLALFLLVTGLLLQKLSRQDNQADETGRNYMTATESNNT